MRTQCTDSETCFYCQKSSQGLTQVIIDWQVHFPALTRHTIFYSLFMKCLVVWRIWIQILIIGTGFTEQLPRKNPFFIIFMPHIPLSEVGNRDAIHVCHGHSFIHLKFMERPANCSGFCGTIENPWLVQDPSCCSISVCPLKNSGVEHVFWVYGRVWNSFKLERDSVLKGNNLLY